MKSSPTRPAGSEQTNPCLFSPELTNRSASFYTIAADAASIICHVCGSISREPRHIAEKYCPRCLVFHEDRILMARLAEGYQKELRSQSAEWPRLRAAA